MRNIRKHLAVLSFFIGAFLPVVAKAEAYIFNTIYIKMGETLNSLQGVVLILGGFGLVVIACGAIFGNMSWKKAGYLAFGLFIVVMPLSIVATVIDAQMMDEVGQAALNYDIRDSMGGVVVTPSD